MFAARPLLVDDLEVGPAGDFSDFSPEAQAIIAAALDRVQQGTTQAVPHAAIEATLERQGLGAI
jgi:hypothetical protein